MRVAIRHDRVGSLADYLETLIRREPVENGGQAARNTRVNRIPLSFNSPLGFEPEPVGGIGLVHFFGSCQPRSLWAGGLLAVLLVTPRARSNVLTADRRMSWTRAPGQPAALQAFRHALRK
jgi:hypothetical protein